MSALTLLCFITERSKYGNFYCLSSFSFYFREKVTTFSFRVFKRITFFHFVLFSESSTGGVTFVSTPSDNARISNIKGKV